MDTVFWLVYAAVVVLMIASMWRIFTKAGKPGWASLIPIYNLVVFCQVAGRPGWWALLLLVPFVNIIIALILSFDLARAFGKGKAYGLGLAIFGFLFYPMLGLGGSRYARGTPPRPARPASQRAAA
jgi:hypothetical protein